MFWFTSYLQRQMLVNASCAWRGFILSLSRSYWTHSLILSVGINMVKRKLAAHDNLKIIIEQTGDNFQVKESSSFRTIDINFTLGVTFDYSLADGTELTVRKRTFSLKAVNYWEINLSKTCQFCCINRNEIAGLLSIIETVGNCWLNFAATKASFVLKKSF